MIMDEEKNQGIDKITGGPAAFCLPDLFAQRIRSFPDSTALLVIDIKRFQMLNHIYGYTAGNEILRMTYQILCSFLNPDETAARLNQDTFVALMQFESRMDLIERILAIDNGIYQIRWQDQWLRILLSFGVCVVKPEDSFLYALDCANIARRNEPDYSRYSSSYEFYDDRLMEKHRIRHMIESQMRDALDHHEFQVYLQPKIRLSDGQITSCEALIRWFHEDQAVPLSLFMPIFNQNTFIRKIDHYVFEEICQLFTRWRNSDYPAVPISLNVSRPSFEDPDYLDETMEIYNRYALPKSLFEFELSEDIDLHHDGSLSGFMKQIKELGFDCSLDDFGSGRSSLNSLQEMPISVLKLDRCFFVNPLNDKNRIILSELLKTADLLNLKVVAEGVETQEYIDFLKDHGCDLIQGFYYSPAVPIADFEVLLKTQPFVCGRESIEKKLNKNVEA